MYLEGPYIRTYACTYVHTYIGYMLLGTKEKVNRSALPVHAFKRSIGQHSPYMHLKEKVNRSALPIHAFQKRSIGPGSGSWKFGHCMPSCCLW